MMTNGTISITAQDIMAAVSFEAKRISASIDSHAAGYPCPPASNLRSAILRMANLVDILVDAESKTDSTNISSSSGMGVELN